MTLPIFIFNIVIEKETKLLEFMKLNGMRMKNYWIINYLFNFIIYMMTVISFIFFGSEVFCLTLI